MRSIVTIEGIDEALGNLQYTNEMSLKYKLIDAIREQYNIAENTDSVPEIDTDYLVKILWETGDDQSVIRNRRKNFNSIKSSVNADLKKLYSEGQNREGIIINQKNIFDMSEEAKSEMLESFSYGSDGGSNQMPLDKITDVLNVINDYISNRESGIEDIDKFNQLKDIIKEISGKVGVTVASREDLAAGGQIARGVDTSENQLYENENTETEGLEKDIVVDAAEGDELEEIPEEELEDLPGEDVEEVLVDDTEDDEYEEIEVDDAPDDEFEEVLDEVEEGEPDEPEGEALEEIEEIPEEELEDLSEEDVEEVLGDDAEEEEYEEVEVDDASDDEFEEVLDEVEEGEPDELAEEALEEIEEIPEEELEDLSEEDVEDVSAGDAEEEEYEEVEVDDVPEEELEEVLDEVEEGEPDEPEGEALEEIEEIPEEELEDLSEEDVEEVPAGDAEDEEYEEVEVDDAPDDEFEEVLDEVEEGEPEEPEGEALEEIEEIPEEELEDLSEEDTEEVSAGDAEEEEYEEVEVDDVPEEELEEVLDEVEEGEPDEPEGEALEEIEEIPEEELEDLSEEDVEEVPAGDAEEEEYEEIEVDDAPDDEFEEVLDEEEEGEPETLEEEALEDIEEIPEEEREDLSEEDVEEVSAGDAEEEEYEEVEIDDVPEEDLEEVLDEVDEYTLEDILEDYDTSGYISEEGREKAVLLADKFDKMLSEAERYYNRYLLIPGGKYHSVNGSGSSDRKKHNYIELPDFYFGKFPVTNNLFELFIEKTGYITTAERLGYSLVYKGRYRNITDEKNGRRTLEWNSSLDSEKVDGACWFRPDGPGSSLHGKRNHPVVQVTLEDAMAFAAWTGKRLPTEEEWEAASRTAAGLIYPWGDSLSEGLCNIESTAIGGTTPVDKYENAANKFGVSDLLGNVLEWTGSKNTLSGKTAFIARGGSWVSGENISLTQRFMLQAKTSSNILGFRCVVYK